MDPADFLNVSSRLYNSKFEEDRRASISRSYYALYLVLHLDLRNRGVQFNDTGKDHSWMIHYLTTCRNANASRIGHALRNLQTNRIIADYRMNATVDVRRSEFAYKSAGAMVQHYRRLNPVDLNAMLQAIISGPPPPP